MYFLAELPNHVQQPTGGDSDHLDDDLIPLKKDLTPFIGTRAHFLDGPCLLKRPKLKADTAAITKPIPARTMLASKALWMGMKTVVNVR